MTREANQEPGGDYQWVAASLKEVQLIGDYLLEEVQKVASQVGVRVFADGGTLLGAVRSGGWIPWDDDVDVVMLRGDFDKMRFQISGLLPTCLRYSDPLLNKDHQTQVARVIFRNSRLSLHEKFNITPPERQHIALDLLVADRAPKSKTATALWLATLRCCQFSHTLQLTEMKKIRNSDERLCSRMLAFSVAGMTRVFPTGFFSKRYNQIAKAFAKSSSDRICITNSGRQFRKVIHNSSIFVENRTRIQFGNLECDAPEIDSFLTAKYGADYINPPPLDLQVGHNFGGVEIRHPIS